MSIHKNILVLTQWSYKDPLIQAYTLPYVSIISKIIPPGSKIYLVTFEQEKLKMTSEERVKIVQSLNDKGIKLLDFNYSKFGPVGFIKWFFTFLNLFSKLVFKNINYIHAWCTPAGSFAYFLSLISGKPLIIDSYEPHAEAMVENGTWKKSDVKFRFLFYLEKKMTKHAEIIISATEGMREYAMRKYDVNIKSFFVKPACVDFDNFNLSKKKNNSLLKELSLEEKVVCVYAGKFGGIYLTTEVFSFFNEAVKIWGDKFRALILTSHDTDEIKKWARENNFDEGKMIIRFVAHDRIQDYMGLADFALTPVKPIPTKKYCTPIKDGEYWALGLPVVITAGISDDSDIILKTNSGSVINSLTSKGYATSLEEIKILLKEPNDLLSQKINKIAHQYRSFQIAENIYFKIYHTEL